MTSASEAPPSEHPVSSAAPATPAAPASRFLREGLEGWVQDTATSSG
ncbi:MULTISPECIES: hypothetical protein [Streptomyces]|nr:hypothetical protein [Streptomyces sp. NRRL S-237]